MRNPRFRHKVRPSKAWELLSLEDIFRVTHFARVTGPFSKKKAMDGGEAQIHATALIRRNYPHSASDVKLPDCRVILTSLDLPPSHNVLLAFEGFS